MASGSELTRELLRRRISGIVAKDLGDQSLARQRVRDEQEAEVQRSEANWEYVNTRFHQNIALLEQVDGSVGIALATEELAQNMGNYPIQVTGDEDGQTGVITMTIGFRHGKQYEGSIVKYVPHFTGTEVSFYGNDDPVFGKRETLTDSVFITLRALNHGVSCGARMTRYQHADHQPAGWERLQKGIAYKEICEFDAGIGGNVWDPGNPRFFQEKFADLLAGVYGAYRRLGKP